MPANVGEIKFELIADDRASGIVKKAGSKINTALKKAGSGAKFLAKHTAKAVAQMSKLALGAAAAMTAVAGKIVSSAIGHFSKFETEMANVSTLVDTSKVSMSKLKKEVMALPSELGSATENAKALYQALSAGIEPAKAVEFVGKAAKAAKAGLTDTFTAVDAGTTVLNAFGLQSEDTTKIFDQMFKTVEQGKTTFAELSGTIGKLSPIAAAASMTTEEMFASIATLTKGGFKTSEAVARMATALGAIVKPSKEAGDLAGELGLEFSAAALKTKGLAGFLDSLKVATGGNIEKMAQLFGGMESLSVMLALTGKQSGEFKNILGEIGQSAGAVDTAFDKQKVTLSSLWETFKNTIGKQAIMLGEKLAPSIKDVIKSTTKWIKENQGLIKTGIVLFAQKFAEAVKWGRDHFKDFVPILKGSLTIIKAVAAGFNAAGKAIGYAAAKAAAFIDKIRKLKAVKFVTKFFIKKSPEVPWSQGIKDIERDMAGLGGKIQKTFDFTEPAKHVESAGKLRREFVLAQPNGAMNVGMAKELNRQQEMYSLQIKLLRQMIGQGQARSGTEGGVTVNVYGQSSGGGSPEELARQIRYELDKLDARGA